MSQPAHPLIEARRDQMFPVLDAAVPDGKPTSAATDRYAEARS
jgi:hypothetical protein